MPGVGTPPPAEPSGGAQEQQLTETVYIHMRYSEWLNFKESGCKVDDDDDDELEDENVAQEFRDWLNGQVTERLLAQSSAASTTSPPPCSSKSSPIYCFPFRPSVTLWRYPGKRVILKVRVPHSWCVHLMTTSTYSFSTRLRGAVTKLCHVTANFCHLI